jgi:hypothetical protein
MISLTTWTRKFGAMSCFAAVLAGLIYSGLASSKEPHLNWIFVLSGVAVLGLLSGIAGLFSSRGKGRMAVLSIVGCVLNLPSAVVGLMLVAVIFGQRHQNSEWPMSRIVRAAGASVTSRSEDMGLQPIHRFGGKLPNFM